MPKLASGPRLPIIALSTSSSSRDIPAGLYVRLTVDALHTFFIRGPVRIRPDGSGAVSTVEGVWAVPGSERLTRAGASHRGEPCGVPASRHRFSHSGRSG